MEPLNEQIEELIADKLSGQIAPENDELLAQLIRTDESVRQQWEASVALLSLYRASKKAEHINEQRAWDKLRAKMPLNEETPVKKLKPSNYKWFAAAAILIPLLLTALWFGLLRSNVKFNERHAKNAERIKVILADGTTYILDGNKDVTAGELKFGAQSAQRTGQNGTQRKNQIITLAIPEGKTYALVLDDGTSVKINSASTFKFPMFFEGHSREVQLDGEAYFEVTKRNHQPFVVKTHEMDVKVLGTKFNVNTYPGNDAQASLVEGSVAVSDHTTKELLIKPGQAAIKSSSNIIRVEAFSADQILSWLHGTYYFNNMTLRDIVNITNRATGEDLYITDSKIANYRFSGALQTGKPIKVLLENIKSSSSVVQYQIKDGKIELY